MRFGSAIEICISNNGSTDDTKTVIAEFQNRLKLKVWHQNRNIGATLNIIAVAQMISGRWGLLVGDDDELIAEAIGELLEFLKTIDGNSWVLVEAGSLEGKQQYFSQFQDGEYGSAQFRTRLLWAGLNSFGFMGVHVFPKVAVSQFGKLDIEDSQPWPHIAALLRELIDFNRTVHLFKRTVVAQAKGGAKLFWTGGDLARIRLAKIRILMRAYKHSRRQFGFYHLMMLRELYARSSFTSLMAWKLYETEDFDLNAVKTYRRSYSWLGCCLPFALPHAALMFFLRILPDSIYVNCFRMIGQGELLPRYQTLKNELGVFDGIKRGI
jgi:glycosyltransferase involved in cell wall biosynthesis